MPPQSSDLRIAFDIGGTFTDFILHDPTTNHSHTLKVPSTPADPGEAVLQGLDQLLTTADVIPTDIDAVLHATTVATNAVLERKGARTALITTEGFRDVLIIGRQKRHETYDLYIDKPKPLLRRREIHEVIERVDHDGSVVIPLDEASVDRVIDALLESDREAVAIALLHAYANPAHEEAIGRRIQERAPHLLLSLSSAVSPRYREYERTSTTVANAYVQPVVAGYVTRLQEALARRGFERELFVMQSSGGLVPPEIAREQPIRIIESGPAAGVLMGGVVGASEGHDHVLTFDMGGTTAKLGAIDAGVPAIMPTFEVDHVNGKKGSGLPVNVPAVEMLEIGAGGGSIARIEMGMIAVGPRSAGADPGPICYGRGGTEPTITDANVVLGYISPGWFNAGSMQLDAKAAEAGIAKTIAEPLGLSLGEAAWGVHLVATGSMENALRIVSVERGRDPRRYALVAFGGAGPLHAARIARAVGIPEVIVPAGAGVGSAIGLLQAAPRIDASVTKVIPLEDDRADDIAAVYERLEAIVRADVTRFGDGAITWTRYAAMRYVGQGFEVHVDLPAGEIDAGYPARCRDAFNEAYLRKHRFLDDEAQVEVVDWTLVATLATDRAAIRIEGDAAREKPGGALTHRPAWFPERGGYVDTRILDRAALGGGETVTGPAIIEDPDSTTVVLPGDVARVSEAGHLVIRIGEEGT